MKILSIYTSLPSSVSMIVDDRVVAAVNEERFTRKKNDESFPLNSINYCLKEAGINPKDLDAVAVASFVSPFDDNLVRKSQWSVDDYLIEQNIRWKPYLIEKTVDKPKSLIETFPNKIDFNQYPSNEN